MGEAFVGRWKADEASFAAMAEKLTAAGQGEMVKGMESMKDFEVAFKDGTFIVTLHYSDGREPRVDHFKLGESHEVEGPSPDVKMTAKSRLEDGKFITDMSMGDQPVMSFVRYIKDGALYTDFTAAGQTSNIKCVKA